MTRAQQRLLAQLATSPNELASGLGQCLEALRLISALPRASPVFVHYTSAPSPGAIKAFGRDHFTRVPLRTVVTLIKTSFSVSEPLRITTALFYSEDGTVDQTPVLVDEDSWKELAPYVHTLYVEDDVIEPRPSTGRSTVSAHSHSNMAIGAVGIGLGSTSGGLTSSSTIVGATAGSSRGPGLNSNASAFVPGASNSTITIKTTDGAKVNLPSLRKPSFSPVASPQATSPFAILDSTGTCV